MTVPLSEDFFLEIESHFALRRNSPFIFNAKDWALMKEWHDTGVPLAVVIEAMDQVFEKNESSGRRKTISSLSYCKHAVKDLWQERKELYIGGGDETPESDAGPMLEALASAIEAASAPPAVLSETARRVRELAALKSVPTIEEALIDLEHELIEQVVTSLAPDDRAELQSDITRSLGDTSRLNEKTRARTEEANLRRLVRDRFLLPRLTLFR